MNKQVYMILVLLLVFIVFTYCAFHYMGNPTKSSIEKCKSYGYETAENHLPYRTYCVTGICGVYIEGANGSDFCKIVNKTVQGTVN